jgi:hypothetical protein
MEGFNYGVKGLMAVYDFHKIFSCNFKGIFLYFFGCILHLVYTSMLIMVFKFWKINVNYTW